MQSIALLKGNAAPAVALGAAVVAAGSLVAWRLLRRQLTEQELERRRRALVDAQGRTIEGEVTDSGDGLLHYTYSVRGMEYVAAQDISALVDVLPTEFSRIVGAVTVKYLRENPANSIVVSEEWSGLGTTPLAAPHTD